MKKIVLFTIALCLLFSCTKESLTKNNIEGTWGLTHYELYDEVDGEMMNQENGDCNPFAPVDDDDQKIVIINTTGNDYLITPYYWDNKKSIWVSDASDKVTWTIIDNKIYSDGENKGQLFQLTSDSLSLEYTSKDEEIGWLYGKEKVQVVHYLKYVFRRMSDLSE